MGERNSDRLPPALALTGHRTYNLGMFSNWESNPWTFALQDVTQPNEPHQSGRILFYDSHPREGKVAFTVIWVVIAFCYYFYWSHCPSFCLPHAHNPPKLLGALWRKFKDLAIGIWLLFPCPLCLSPYHTSGPRISKSGNWSSQSKRGCLWSQIDVDWNSGSCDLGQMELVLWAPVFSSVKWGIIIIPFFPFS